MVRELVRPRDDDVVETLEWCRSHSIKVGLISNTYSDVPAIFCQHPMAKLFDTAVFSCDVGLEKPDPRIYNLACDRLGVDAQDCVYLGDGSSDELNGARSVGMCAVFLKLDDEIEMEGLPSSVADWTGPTIRTFGEIRRFFEIEGLGSA